MALQVEDDEKRLSDEVEYEAIIEKVITLFSVRSEQTNFNIE
jgi:hypothetical protein